MRALFSAAAASGAVGLVPWAVTEITRRSLQGREGVEMLNGMFFAIAMALVASVLAPLIAGFCAGMLSGSAAAAVGSVAAFLSVTLGAVLVLSGEIRAVGEYLLPAVVLGVLVTAGHLTGVVVRPRLRPA
jgi:hypothetical protein